MLSWFLVYTFLGWLAGASLYWRFSNPHLTETQHIIAYWQDYLFLLSAAFVSWIGVNLTWPRPKKR
jgi:hypothetical protein